MLQWGKEVGAWYKEQRAKNLPPVVRGVVEPAFTMPESPEEAAPILATLLGQLTGEPHEVKPMLMEGQDFLFISPHEGLTAKQHEALVSLDLPRGAANGIQDHTGHWSLCGLTPNEWPRWIARLRATYEARRLLKNPKVASIIAQADDKVFYAAGARATLLCRWGTQLAYYQVAPNGSLEEILIDPEDIPSSAEEEISLVRQNAVGWLLCMRCGGPVTAGECLSCGQENA